MTMTAVFITVHDDLSYAYRDQKTLTTVERATCLPIHIWQQATADERARIMARISAISDRIGQRYRRPEDALMGLSSKQAAALLRTMGARKRLEKLELARGAA